MAFFHDLDRFLHSDMFLAFAALAVLMALVYAALAVKTPQTEPDPDAFWQKTRAGLGLEVLPMPVFYAAVALWAALLASLFAGLLVLIWRVILHAAPDSGAVWDYRFLLAQLVATITVLGAVVALPFTIIGIKINRATQTTHADALFNDKVNAALTDLHAQRQVTLEESGKRVDVWQDDIVRRNGAIDRIEALARENPTMAPRLARMLATYVRELSAEYPPQKPPEGADPEALRDWAGKLKPPRSDMENAAQTLGRFLAIPGLTPETLRIDLHGANLQGMLLVVVDLRNANLLGAHLEGTELGGAQLAGAFLHNAHLEGAYLGGANVENADLSKVHLEGADLMDAYLKEAYLIEAHVEGANLHLAQLDGADLTGAHLHESTDFRGATTTQAVLQNVDLTDITLSADQIASMFGDASVVLPEGMPRPAHWPDASLRWGEFVNEWDAYKSNPAAYVPPQDRPA